MMAEYIERESVLDEFFYVLRDGEPSMADYEDAKAVINSIPAADVRPVVRGEWEVVEGYLTPGGDPLLRCPFCKSVESEHVDGSECHDSWNFCPNCGADMRGEVQ